MFDLKVMSEKLGIEERIIDEILIEVGFYDLIKLKEAYKEVFETTIDTLNLKF